jgi:hypothetical protein
VSHTIGQAALAVASPVAPTKGRCNSNLPPVVPAVERRALPAFREPTIAATPRPGATPFGSAPSLGSRPPNPDGRTRGGTTALSISAAQGANRFGNRLLRTRTTGFRLRCCGRSIFRHFIAIRVWVSICDLSGDNNRADKTAAKIPRHIPSLPLCVLAQYFALVVIAYQGPSPRAVVTSYHRIGSRRLSCALRAGD